MQEIEVKILGIDVLTTVQNIIDLGGVKVFDGEIRAFYFDTPDKSLSKRGSVYRLRQVGDERTELVLKNRLPTQDANPEFKQKEEIEVTVSDFGTMERMLKSLGYIKVAQERKHRVSYHLEDIKIEFDKLPHPDIPTFMELEATSITTIARWVTKLGFKMSDTIPWSANQVAAHYGHPELYRV